MCTHMQYMLNAQCTDDVSIDTDNKHFIGFTILILGDVSPKLRLHDFMHCKSSNAQVFGTHTPG